MHVLCRHPAAAAGVALDNRQRKSRRKRCLPPQRFRPFAMLTALALLVLAIGSTIFHGKFPELG